MGRSVLGPYTFWVNVEHWEMLNLNPAIWKAIAGTGWPSPRSAKFLLREAFDEVVEEGLAFVEGGDGHALVAAVEADVVAVEEEALHTVGWNSGDSKVFAVGGPHHHHGD